MDISFTRRNPQVRVSVEQMIDDLCEMLAKIPLSEEQASRLYKVITNRVCNVTCWKCGKLRPIIDGTYTYPDGDLSKPKRFVCGGCAGGL